MDDDGTFVIMGGDKFSFNEEYGELFFRSRRIHSITDIKGLENISNRVKIFTIIESPMTNLDGIECLTNLEQACFSNRLQSLESIQACTKLHILQASGNEIKSIAPLAPLMELECCELQNNQIENIEGIAGKTSLRMLNLSGNRIAKIKGLDGCSSLHRLELSRNNIKRIEGLDSVPELADLLLAGNQITRIENLENVPQLKELGLSENRIKKLENLDNLPALGLLGLINNDIKCIENINHLTAEVTLEGNPVIAGEVEACNHNPALWCAIKVGLERFCEEMETSNDCFGNVDDLEVYVESYLHVRDAYDVVAGHPAGKIVDFLTKPTFYSHKVWDTIDGIAKRIVTKITDLAIYFGMDAQRPAKDWINANGPGFAEYLLRAVPGIVTWRWPDWLLADACCLITNETIVIDSSTQWSWIYFRAGSYFVNRASGIPMIFVKIFFGRTRWRMSQSPIHLFKPEITEGMTWKLFSKQIDTFINMQEKDVILVEKPSAFLLRHLLDSKFPDYYMDDFTVY